MDPSLLYDSPFLDMAPEGPQQAFEFEITKRIIDVIKEFNQSAVG